MLDTLSWLGKQAFKHSEFKKFYTEQSERSGGELPSFERIRDILFEYSVIGRVINNRHTFKYQTPKSRPRPLDEKDTICIHRGLHGALNIRR